MAKCLLVYVPGLPLRVEHLMPQEELAQAAAYLRQAGNTVQILDFGAVLAETSSEAPPAARRFWPFNTLRETALDSHLAALVSRLNAVISSLGGGLDLVAFLVHERDGLAMSTKVNALYQQGIDAARAVTFGTYAERFAPYICAYNPVFDAAITQEPGAVLSHLLGAADCGFSGTPGLVVREREGAAFTGKVARPSGMPARPLPDYSEAVYPQLYTGEKLRYFGLRQHAGTAPSLMARVRNIREHFGPGVLHFACGSAQPAQISALNQRVRDHGAPCTMSASVPAVGALPSGALRAMNCVAVHLEVHTGSQRLLDDFYSAGFTVSEMEAAFRVVRGGGAALHAGFHYPCPWDDRHTEAETLRIVQRNRPEAVSLRPPEFVPGTPWYANPSHYGYRLEHRRFARWASCADVLKPRSPAPAFELSDAAPLHDAIAALGSAAGAGVHELMCASLSVGEGSVGEQAVTIRDLVAWGGAAAVRSKVASLNDAIAEASAQGNRAGLGPFRAAIGN